MRAYLATAPAWVLVLLQGVVYIAVWVSWSIADGQSHVWHALIEGAVLGLVCAVADFITTREQRATRATRLAPLSGEQKRAAIRAAARGPLPSDPAVRSAAAALVADQLADCERNHNFFVSFFAICAAVATLIALAGDRWFLTATAIFGAALISTLRAPRKLAKRLAGLESVAPVPGRFTAAGT